MNPQVRFLSILGLLLRLVVLQRRLDRVLCQHGAMELDRGKGELLRDLRVLDARCLGQILPLKKMKIRLEIGNSLINLCTALQ